MYMDKFCKLLIFIHFYQINNYFQAVFLKAVIYYIPTVFFECQNIPQTESMAAMIMAFFLCTELFVTLLLFFFFQLQGYVQRLLAFALWEKVLWQSLNRVGVWWIIRFLPYLDPMIYVILALTGARFLCGSKY